MSLEGQLQSLAPGAMIELFELDSTALGGAVTRFHAGTNSLNQPVVWQGQTYTPFPIEASGFDRSAKGTLPRPTVRVANVSGLIGALCQEMDDLIGAKVTRKRTLSRFLDAVNFPGAVNPEADPNAHLADDIFYVERRVAENAVYVEFELASALDLMGVKLPRRQVIQNCCTWAYRSPECGYSGPPVADTNDQRVNDPALDRCGKRLLSCKLRHGEHAELPYGGFPGAGLHR